MEDVEEFGQLWSLLCQRNISKIKWQQKRTKRRVTKQADINMSCEQRRRRCNLRQARPFTLELGENDGIAVGECRRQYRRTRGRARGSKNSRLGGGLWRKKGTQQVGRARICRPKNRTDSMAAVEIMTRRDATMMVIFSRILSKNCTLILAGSNGRVCVTVNFCKKLMA